MSRAGVDIEDLRKSQRFIARQVISGSFGAAGISVVDLSCSGAQVEHGQPLRVGSRGRFVIAAHGLRIAEAAVVMWSHLSKSRDGKMAYRSGLRIEGDDQTMRSVVMKLQVAGVIGVDNESLERKRQRELERQREQQVKARVIQFNQPAVSVDEVLMIAQARERLRAQPAEAIRWINRAKYSNPENGGRYREDVLAIWEYLEHRVDASTISHVLDQRAG